MSRSTQQSLTDSREVHPQVLREVDTVGEVDMAEVEVDEGVTIVEVEWAVVVVEDTVVVEVEVVEWVAAAVE